MQPQLRKACPRCRTTTSLTAACCLYCGHQYRTLFVPPQPASAALQPTRKLTVLAPVVLDTSARQAAVALAAVIALSGLISLAAPSQSSRTEAFSRTDKMRKEKPSQSLSRVSRFNSESHIVDVQTR